MKKPKKAFAVTAGEYSDYRVWAIFDTKKRAEKFLSGKGYEFKTWAPKGVWDPGAGWVKDDDWEDPRIEEFDYYDDDVLPLSG